MKRKPKRRSPTCTAPDEKGRLCGRPATEERIVEDIVFPLCQYHAEELDQEEE